jgi:hypothetical protein
VTTPAEKNLDEAIGQVVAEGHPGHVVTGWIAMAAVIGTEETECSGVTWVLPDGIHWTQLLGLVEAVRLRLRSQFLAELE